jgi:hypothetical protein
MKILTFLKKYRDLIYLVLILIAILVISLQQSKLTNLNNLFDRQTNNYKALTEEIVNYKDELGRSNAEKHAYQLTQEELRDSIGLLKRKNYEYLSYINTIMNIKDTVKIDNIVIKEIAANVESDTLVLGRSDVFGKSSRNISVDMIYGVHDNKVYVNNMTFHLDQNIFVEGWLERNVKNNETYIHLMSDYPNLIFNSGLGIVAQSGKSYDKSMRKSCGIGLSIGPTIGMNYDLINKKIVPTIGVGMTIGFNYTPKFLQW